MAKNRTYLTLSQAAKQTGKSKSVISKALKNGTLSYASKESSGYRIDAAELFRVFAKHENENVQRTRSRTPENGGENPYENALKIRELETENKLLHERMKDKEARIEELQEERNEWRSQAQRLLLTHQHSQDEAEKAAESKKEDSSGQLPQKVETLLRRQPGAIVTVLLMIAVLALLVIANMTGVS